MISETGLTQLPVSRDLWRGHVRQPKNTDNVQLGDAPRPFAKIDEAMANILKTSKGAKELTCTWCGYQSADSLMREHLKKNHASIVQPPTDEQIMAASIATGAKEK